MVYLTVDKSGVRQPARCFVLLPQQHRHSRKDKMPGGIVDDVDLAGVEAWFQLRERHVQLKDGRMPVGNTNFLNLRQRRLVSLYVPLEERNVTQQPDGVFHIRVRAV